MAVPTEPARRTSGKIIALFLAVFFLAVIGASAGYILGLRAKHHRTPAPQPAAVATTSAPATAPPAAKACPPETERDAKQKFKSPGGLVQVFFLLTDKDDVWICRDSAGALFYQGHVLSDAERQGGPREPLVDQKNSLLLKSVKADGNGGWIAENTAGGRTTRYLVSAAKLVIEYANGTRETHQAIRHEP